MNEGPNRIEAKPTDELQVVYTPEWEVEALEDFEEVCEYLLKVTHEPTDNCGFVPRSVPDDWSADYAWSALHALAERLGPEFLAEVRSADRERCPIGPNETLLAFNDLCRDLFYCPCDNNRPWLVVEKTLHDLAIKLGPKFHDQFVRWTADCEVCKSAASIE